MKVFKGKAVSAGTALGASFVIKDFDISISKTEVTDTSRETDRLQEAVSGLISNLEQSRGKVKATHSEDSADILNTHIMLLSDSAEESLVEKIKEYICAQKVNAEYAAFMVGADLADGFKDSKSDYLRARSEDILHISKMLVCELMKDSSEGSVSLCAFEGPKEPSILVSAELSPEMLISVDPSLILGIVTQKGSPLSHTAILAQNMSIPYITGVEGFKTDELSEVSLIIDGKNNKIIAEPDKNTIETYLQVIEEEKQRAEYLEANALKMIYDSPVRLLANIGKPEEAAMAVDKGAQGIGLMRSEFLYMDRDEAPNEEEQYEAYVKVLDTMNGKPVTVRTIDIGADKEARCVNLPKEDNPALGTRGIRISFANPELFITQLRALLRASYGRNLKIMFPMITSEWEVVKAIDYINKADAMLTEDGIEHSIPPVGIMVETPAAVLSLEKIAPHISFISIGTNDLTQYTLGIDRMGDGLNEYFDPHHEAVLKLIEMTVNAARKFGLAAGICGELGGDTELSEYFMKLGLDELSMSSGKIPKVALKLSEVNKPVDVVAGP